jgi:transposase
MLGSIRMSKTAVVPGVASSPRRRRRWPLEQKRRIVEATLAPGASIAQVAREHGVNANQLHSWRRLHERGSLGEGGPTAALLPVRLVPEAAERLPAGKLAEPPPDPARGRRVRPAGVIQVESARGRLRVEGTTDPWTLRIVLESLLG